ncbi:hypothetical protein H6G80_31850 [Nostoc sp. FACHB-87]|uniref:hypothetical protein n=1 Tax=Nostocales TaxID=1161 RepID=UPI0016861CB9|nr:MULTISPECIES: hypothetical protein [Nostocales]MBD2301974.1 hypothetical protein [Nostoc sp. FACHB-190]MBD2458646.1 hypothetical protein [Nostoc sp. FACHB-87]MBD2479642.1 hypothetical protein [Anabaena sp. FACHB-83]MBD2489650.1 hypothetical protein [Aulosira sp. FACHB-615]
MFTIGDYVLNQQTGHLGKVIGYGQQTMNPNMQTVTLKVLVAETANSQRREFVFEDQVSAWVKWSTEIYQFRSTELKVLSAE